MLVRSPVTYKFEIDPENTDHVGTICSYIRAIYRAADKLDNEEIKELARAAFDKGNRMDRSLKKYRKRFMILPEEIQKEMIDICP